MRVSNVGISVVLPLDVEQVTNLSYLSDCIYFVVCFGLVFSWV